MKRSAILWGFLLSLAMPAAAQLPPPPSPEKVRARDLAAGLRLLETWWPGQYDNHEQTVRQSGGGISPPISTPFRRVHTDVRRLAVLGDHVVAIEQYADNDARAVLKREVAVFAVDGAADAIRVKRYRLSEGQSLDDAAAKALTPAALLPLGERCDLLLRYVGDQFQGGLAGRGCPATTSASDYQLAIGSGFLWERGLARDARTKGSAVPPSDWYRETRARPYTCNIFANMKGEMAKTEFLQTIHLHDQGGEADIAWPDGRTLTFTIHQRAFASPPEREYPLFRIHEKGNPVPIAYAYAVDRNTRFGLNLGWFYIRCYDDADIAPVDMLEAKK